eukprot:5306868-Pyramimonas_sp.AAC.1
MRCGVYMQCKKSVQYLHKLCSIHANSDAEERILDNFFQSEMGTARLQIAPPSPSPLRQLWVLLVRSASPGCSYSRFFGRAVFRGGSWALPRAPAGIALECRRADCRSGTCNVGSLFGGSQKDMLCSSA